VNAPEGRLHFGRYETLFPIATGGMAEVYAARALGEAGFQKLVALKRMKPELAEDPRFVTMFLDEGRMAANISSPNVVATLDLGRAEDNSLFLVMELVTGVSLAALLGELTSRQKRIPVPIAVEIIAQAANGLHDAHEALAPTGEPLGIVHRDCSPHNVLVDIGGQVKITDFGIAKALERQTQSHAGEMKGKLSYLSPEQARGNPVDRRADVFILGVVAWELIAQRRCFDAKSTVEVLHKVVAMPIPRLTEMRDDVPENVADAIVQALERDPEERFQTTRAFGNSLIHSLGDRRPRRAELGAFIQQHGGPSLLDLQRQIRETFQDLSRSEVQVPPLGESVVAKESLLKPPPAVPGPAMTSQSGRNLLEADPLDDLVVDPNDPLGGATIQDMPRVDMPRIEPPDTIPTGALQGVKIQLGPPPDLLDAMPSRPSMPGSGQSGTTQLLNAHGLVSRDTDPEPRVAEPPPRLPGNGSGLVFAVLFATLIAVAAGVGGAWMLRGDSSTPRDDGPSTSGPQSADPPPTTAPPGPPDPAEPDEVEVAAELPPPTPPPSTEERDEALAATRTTPSTPTPTARRRRRRRGVNPRTVRGDRVPAGDRQAAFDEIPW